MGMPTEEHCVTRSDWRVGSGVGAVGDGVGCFVGLKEGADVGRGVGVAVGGLAEGAAVGSRVGVAVVGLAVGAVVGKGEGLTVGLGVGRVGADVGLLVGTDHHQPSPALLESDKTGTAA
jgi:hypothetical protein